MANEPTKFISTGRNDSDAVNALNGIFERAAREGASDVHFEDDDVGSRVRFRFSGALQDVARFDSQTTKIIDAKIRSKCMLSLSERRNSQDGRFFIEVDDRLVDIRVSLLPSRTGQSIVCRLLDQRNASRKIGDIHLPPEAQSALVDLLAEPDGLILMTGPTGSGKTSSLYAMLNFLNTPDIKIVTAEDPVEYRLEGAVQVNINDQLTFARALRSILRQDPDIVLVGEIRDQETAGIAVQASMTGHLVLSTLHANDAATTLIRMIDLGVDPFTLGATIKCVMSQRLLKRLCPHCREEYRLDKVDLAWIDATTPQYAEDSFYRANTKGCEHCQGGYDNRVPVVEMLLGDQNIRHAILNSNRNEIAEAARLQKQYSTLQEAGVRLARSGETTLVEVRRISSMMDHRRLEQVLPLAA